MGKVRVLVVTTALHHKHRYRLHNFLPYLSKYLDLDVLELPNLGYDIRHNEDLFGFLLRVLNEEKFLNNKYDAVLATPFLAGFIALEAHRHLKEIPIIYEDVDRFYEFFHNPIKRLLAKFVEYKSIKEADAVIAASPHLYIEDVKIRESRPTFYVPNGIEFNKFRRIAGKIKRRNKFAIVYVGAIEWWSGLDIAIYSMRYVVKRIPEAKFFIIGEFRTNYGIYLRKLVKSLNLYENVVFLGRRPYEFVMKFLTGSSIGIITFPRHPITTKAFPYKVLEYCAAGLPIVMTNVTALAPIVEKFSAGSVHDVNDIEGISSSITELMLDESSWMEKSENAIRLASIFDVERLAKLESKIIYQLSN